MSAMERAACRRLPSMDQVPLWCSGIMLSVAVLMIAGLSGLIIVRGLGALWPAPLWRMTLTDSSVRLGLIHAAERIPHPEDRQGRPLTRTLLRVGNRDLSSADFIWIDDARINVRERPADAVVVERTEWGPFYGFLAQVQAPGQPAVTRSQEAWTAFRRQLPLARHRAAAIQRLQHRTIDDLNASMEAHRLGIARLRYHSRLATSQTAQQIRAHEEAIAQLQQRYLQAAELLVQRREEDATYRVTLRSIEGRTKELPISAIVRCYQPNRLSIVGRVGVYLDRLGEFIGGQPREANSEGGVAPAIFGTVMMTLLMTLAVVPLGVLAALYLHEYARQGWLVSMVRIAVNNLAGVPSIVFGVFGLGFFCYGLGGAIDQLWFPERLPAPTFGGGGILWASLTLALLTVPVVIVSTEEALAAVPNGLRAASLACGATQFQTICRVILPSALPGIMTGAILAMARGAGEVAPLMITGVVKLAPDLPIDRMPPFLHLERKFMHLGFHIYDVGFQSPNIEASKAMVYMTALLLLVIVLCLNVAAMRLRAHLRERFRGAEH